MNTHHTSSSHARRGRARTTTALSVTALAALTVLTACAGQAPESASADVDPASEQSDVFEAFSGENFDLEELIAKAQEEGPITIYDNASAVEDIAANFFEKYGIEATGSKVDASEALEMVTRESQAGNVVGDVITIQDLPALKNQLVPNNFVTNWIPEDAKEHVDESMQDPLVMVSDSNVWTFNNESTDTCPVSNLWELTEPEWNGKVALEDPVGANKLLDWFSQMGQFDEEALAAAYEEHFGEELTTDEDSASAEWVSRLAANDPILTSSNEDVSEAVGAPGQSEPPIGLVSSSKFRNIEEKGYFHEICDGLQPWEGIAQPKGVVIASGTENPHAAMLYVHYVLTEEGILPQNSEGKISSNTAIAQPEDPSNLAEHLDQLYYFDNAGLDEDWDGRQQWQDLWRVASQ